jgi:hypothetical protein
MFFASFHQGNRSSYNRLNIEGTSIEYFINPKFPYSSKLNGARFLNDGSVLIVDSYNHNVMQIFPNGTYNEVVSNLATVEPNDIAISSDNRYVYFSAQSRISFTGELWLWDRITGSLIDFGFPKMPMTNGIEVLEYLIIRFLQMDLHCTSLTVQTLHAK